MVQVTVGTKTSQKTRKSQAWSLWKMNESLLENEEFKNGVESALQNIECTKHGWGQKWEMFKQEIRKMSIELSSIVAYRQKIEERRLNKDILYLYRLECQEPGKYKDDIKNLRKQIEEHDKLHYGGAAVRTLNTYLASHRGRATDEEVP